MIKEVAQRAVFTHYNIHREALVTKRMQIELKTALEQAMKVVNFIKSRAPNSRIFTVYATK
jgi:hypothetical protein